MYRTLKARCLSCEDCERLNEMEQAIFNHTQHASRLLDYGAGDKRLKGKFVSAGFKGRYETLDMSAED